MRIIGLKEFLAMPAGTVFAKYKPQVFDGLCIKGESIIEASDFFYQTLWEVEASNSKELYEKIDAAENRGVDVPIDVQCGQRDGLFQYDQLFAVFSAGEVRRIAESLVGEPTTTLTDAEQWALREAAGAYNDNDDDEECAKIAATLSGLLRRLG